MLASRMGWGSLPLLNCSRKKKKKKTYSNFSSSFSFLCQLRKPLIERKRRERINNCLDQLKETVVGAFHLDVSAHFCADFCPFACRGVDWDGGGASLF